MVVFKKTVPVSRRALIARINRMLEKEGWRRLRTCRAERWRRELGDFYILDVDRNRVIETKVDLEELARKLKVLRTWERLEDAEG